MSDMKNDMVAVNNRLLHKIIDILDSDEEDDDEKEFTQRLIRACWALAASRKPIPEPEAKP